MGCVAYEDGGRYEKNILDYISAQKTQVPHFLEKRSDILSHKNRKIQFDILKLGYFLGK